MSLHVLANHMATKGRGPDSMLVHMTPEEVASLQALALKNGGSLTINPETGLPEAGFLKKLLPAIAGFALNAFLPGVGTAIGGALGTSAAVGTGIAVGGITGLATGSLSKGLMAGLGAYGGAGLADSFMGAGAGAGLNNALANAGTAEGAQGQAFNEFLKSDANPAVMSSADKLSAGFNAVKEAPGAFLKDNWKMGLAAASPFIADAMVPTTVKAPNAQSTGYIRPFQFDENTRTVRAMDPVLASEWGARQFPDFIRKGQTAPPAGMGQQLPPGMARGGIVALADGGETDPYARFNTLSGQSKDAYDYLMGNIQRVPAADLTTPTRPVVSNTNTTPTIPAVLPPGESAPTPVAPTPPTTPYIPEPTPTPINTPIETDPYDQEGQDAIDKYAREIAEEQRIAEEQADEFRTASDIDDATISIEDQYDQEGQDAIDKYEREIAEETQYDREGQDAIDKYEREFDEQRADDFRTATDIDDATISIEDQYGQQDAEQARQLFNAFERRQEREAEQSFLPSPDEDFPSTYPPETEDNYDFGGSDTYGLGGYDFGNFGGFGGGIRGYELAAESNAHANGGLMAVQRYADGGVSGSGSLDLHVPINIGAGGGGIGGGFNGGYTPAGSNGSAGNMNPNTGGGLSGIAGLFGGQPQAQPYQPYQPSLDPIGQVQDTRSSEEIMRSFASSLKGPGYDDVHRDWEMSATRGYNPFTAKLPEFNMVDDRSPERRMADEKLVGTNPALAAMANGGMVPGYALGGLGALGGYSDGGRLLKGPGDGVSDSIPATIGRNKQPARLADGEFVVPARIVSELGNGSTEAGARKLYAMMDRIQKARGKTVGKGKVAANSRSDKHLPA